MIDFTKLIKSVTDDTTATGSAVTLLNGISTQLKAQSAALAAAIAANDPTAAAAAQAQIDQLQATLDQNTQALAAAVTANTPAATS